MIEEGAPLRTLRSALDAVNLASKGAGVGEGGQTLASNVTVASEVGRWLWGVGCGVWVCGVCGVCGDYVVHTFPPT